MSSKSHARYQVSCKICSVLPLTNCTPFAKAAKPVCNKPFDNLLWLAVCFLPRLILTLTVISLTLVQNYLLLMRDKPWVKISWLSFKKWLRECHLRQQRRILAWTSRIVWERQRGVWRVKRERCARVYACVWMLPFTLFRWCGVKNFTAKNWSVNLAEVQKWGLKNENHAMHYTAFLFKVTQF